MRCERPCPAASPVPFPLQTALRGHGVLTRPAFGFRMPEVANRSAQWITSNLYDRGEGVRYAVEQTLGYTVPRTYQQLHRTFHITGKRNVFAGLEMLIRDLMADITDTFLPGLIGTWAIGWSIDKVQKTALRFNLGPQGMAFYTSHMKTGTGQWATQQAFYQNLEQALKDHAHKAMGANPSTASLGLEKGLTAVAPRRLPFFGKTTIPDGKQLSHLEQRLADALRLTHHDLLLPLRAKAGKAYETSLRELLLDLWRMHHVGPKYEGRYWGQEATRMLEKTARFSKFQMLGNLFALVASISIPFVVRLMTKHFYGQDSFPGTQALKDFFHGNKQKKRKADGFEWFPYLKRSLGQGDWMPTAVTALFFAVLGGAVWRRFHKAEASLFRLKDWFRVYKFQRTFPYTTVDQMELTYGLLCGIRLAASRDDAEFRESAVRDCLLGWPTLTYFFPWFRKRLSLRGEYRLARKFNRPNLLIKPNGAVRGGDEIYEAAFRPMNLGSRLKQALATTRLYQSWITLISAGTSWGLLAFAEPQVGIWLTNTLALRHFQKQHAQRRPAQPATP